MKAMQLFAHAAIETRPLRRVDLPKPTPTDNSILVKVAACGVCRTDLHVIEGDLKGGTLPIVPGHQVVGVVEDIGRYVQRFSVGDRVGIPWLQYTCGGCPFCEGHRENLCPNSLYTGFHINGGYADYAVVSEGYAYEIPGRFDEVDAAPLLCAGIVGYRALKRAELPAGGRLGIYGFGSSAHIIIQIARYRGCEVYVATRSEEHQKLALSLGAAWAGPGNAILPTLVQSVIVFAPAGELVPLALQSLEPGGTVSLAGIHMSDIPAMSYASCLFHEKNIRSVESNTRADGEEFLALAAEIPIKPIVQSFPMIKANEVLLALKEHSIQGTAVLVNS